MNPNHAIQPMVYGARMSIIDVKILLLIEWSHSPPHHVTTDPKMVTTKNPISFQHTCLWYSFLNPHLTTYHSKIDVHIIAMLEFRDIYLIQSEGLNYNLAFPLDWELPMVGIFVETVWGP